MAQKKQMQVTIIMYTVYVKGPELGIPNQDTRVEHTVGYVQKYLKQI